MATRSRIGIKNQDGTIESIYCHWDGYISNNGKILVEHYSNETKVRELIALGDCSSLAPNLYPTGEHSFDSPEKDVVVFYGRDRGEDGCNSDVSSGMKEYQNIGEAYNYLFVDGDWFYGNNKSVKEALEKAE